MMCACECVCKMQGIEHYVYMYIVFYRTFVRGRKSCSQICIYMYMNKYFCRDAREAGIGGCLCVQELSGWRPGLGEIKHFYTF